MAGFEYALKDGFHVMVIDGMVGRCDISGSGGTTWLKLRNVGALRVIG